MDNWDVEKVCYRKSDILMALKNILGFVALTWFCLGWWRCLFSWYRVVLVTFQQKYIKSFYNAISSEILNTHRATSLLFSLLFWLFNDVRKLYITFTLSAFHLIGQQIKDKLFMETAVMSLQFLTTLPMDERIVT